MSLSHSHAPPPAFDVGRDKFDYDGIPWLIPAWFMRVGEAYFLAKSSKNTERSGIIAPYPAVVAPALFNELPKDRFAFLASSSASLAAWSPRRD